MAHVQLQRIDRRGFIVEHFDVDLANAFEYQRAIGPLERKAWNLDGSTRTVSTDSIHYIKPCIANEDDLL